MGMKYKCNFRKDFNFLWLILAASILSFTFENANFLVNYFLQLISLFHGHEI